MRYLTRFLFALLIVAGLSACSNFLNPSTKQNKVTGESIEDAGDLQGLMKGALDRMNDVEYYGRDFVVYGAVRTDNAFSNAFSGRFIDPSEYTMNYNSGYAEGTWEKIYQVIANTNLIINAEVPENPEVNHVKGQAYALRALAHMDLLRLYGQTYVDGDNRGVPYITTYAEGNTTPSRGSVSETWNKIGQDLQKANDMMKPSLDAGSGSSIDPTSITTVAVDALRARYFLNVGEYDHAEMAAEAVINSGKVSLASASNYVSTWGASGSSNTIFELAYSTSDDNELSYIYLDTNYGDVEMTPELYNLYGANDVRNNLTFVDSDGSSYRTSKYPDPGGTDHVQVIRYAEVILIYAEALLRTNEPAAALTQLNKIPNNRNASTYSTASIDNILLERRKELAMEGFRFYDLARTGRDIVRNVSGHNISVPYGSPELAFPIPKRELDVNPNISQNQGYGGDS